MDFCTLFSGSSGNSTFLRDGKSALLIDAGVSMRAIEQALCSIGEQGSNLSGILVTHEHIDHIRGLMPLARRYHMPLYANEGTAQAICHRTGASLEQFHIFETACPFSVGSFLVLPFETPHDSAASVGYLLENEAGQKAAVATDLGHISEPLMNALCGADIVLIEANHDEDMLQDGPYPYPLKKRILSDYGHLSNVHCGEAACRIAQSGTKHIFLGHLSSENNDPYLAHRTVSRQLEHAGVSWQSDISLSVAPRSTPGAVIHI